MRMPTVKMEKQIDSEEIKYMKDYTLQSIKYGREKEGIKDNKW